MTGVTGQPGAGAVVQQAADRPEQPHPGTAGPTSTKAAEQPATDATGRLCDFVAAIRPRDLPAPVVAAAELSLLDAVGVSLAASALDPGARAFLDLVTDEGGRHDSTVMGRRARVPAAAAALANGALAHALDFEDALDGLPIHPNAQVIPAVLALAEQRDLPGDRVLAAIAVGCDVTVRLAAAAGRGVDAAGWYPPPIFGALGSAAGCANLVGLDADGVRDALSLALSQVTGSGQIKHSPQSLVRGVRDSFAAHAAVRAVELAERGITGFVDPLAGPRGFFATYAAGDYDLASLTDGLGAEFGGTSASYKLWPSCRGTHAFVEGALALREQLAGEVVAIELWGGPVCTMLAEPQEAKRRPTTAIDAKFSLPFTVATTLVHGGPTLASFSTAALGDPAVLQMAERVTFTVDPAFTGAEHMTSGRIAVSDASGQVHTREVHAPRGSLAAPLTRAELMAKFTACAAEAGIAPADARERATWLLSIGSVPAVGDELAAVLAV